MSIKEQIVSQLVAKQKKKYDKELAYQATPYANWIRENENTKPAMNCQVIGLADFVDCVKTLAGVEQFSTDALSHNPSEAYLAVVAPGCTLDMPNKEESKEFFAKDSNFGLVYPDEDMQTKDTGRRFAPWYKPDESPETLLSYFYYGSAVFLQKKTLVDALHLYAREEHKIDSSQPAAATAHADAAPGSSPDNLTHLSEKSDTDTNAVRKIFYDFILFYTEHLATCAMTVGHVKRALCHTQVEEDAFAEENPLTHEVVNAAAYWGYTPDYDEVKLAAFARRGIAATMEHYSHGTQLSTSDPAPVSDHASADDHTPSDSNHTPSDDSQTASPTDDTAVAQSPTSPHTIYSVPVYTMDGAPKVSIVIPSKDNLPVLTTCLRTIREQTQGVDYEIILVDNGSSEENRLAILELNMQYPFTYIYQPMEFNFSRMCNLGVEKATGDYILLLNDDIEIISPDWLYRMLGQAMQPGIGAVGAKLLFPQTGDIQHIGITNLVVGPAHKENKEPDAGFDYYYGKNTLPSDMIGVTAACLLVKKSIYQEVGGFCEDIQISYNDVDFNFALYEAGYRNVMRPDVTLFHHESLSRGDDRLSDAKWERLLKEKATLYRRHPQLEGKDPYYNPNLVKFNHKYFCGYQYPFEQYDLHQKVTPFTQEIQPEWHNNCLTVTLEHVKLDRRLNLTDENDVYWLEGWSYVLGMDNCRYERSLIFTAQDGSRYQADICPRYRRDVVEILPDEQNVELSGFSCRFKTGELAEGNYTVGVLSRDTCSRQILYNPCDTPLVVEKTR